MQINIDKYNSFAIFALRCLVSCFAFTKVITDTYLKKLQAVFTKLFNDYFLKYNIKKTYETKF